MKIFVSNWPKHLGTESVEDLFGAYGVFSSIELGREELTGKVAGYVIVEMPDDEAAREAIEVLDGFYLEGSTIKVQEAIERGANTQRTLGGGGGYKRRD